MHLRYLQIRLMDISVSLQFDGETEIVAHERDLGNLLRQYTQGVQDYEYMIKVSQQPYDFFVMSAQRIQDRRLLDGAMASRSKSPSDLEPDGIMATGPWEVSKLRKDIELAAAAVAVAPAGNGVPAAPPAQGLPEQLTEPIGGTRPDRLKSLLQRAFWLRVGESVVGGAFVIGPMWLLALKQDLIFQLGATTICVAGFGTILAWYSDAPGQVFAATLAYAAILMVFVGVMVDNS
ncbi:hypothetical protein NKR23_g8664 [Pleurostoma richardsiae]|uniref:DUF6594 domain-containing protein n=1 Tax=Pleurostoma richardsiae TaxID=41990 RepID=A0AA38RJH3_9PEZI|nr:hypothetical protein NKR23_g8664 [Pleurostoma richardsiae]